MQEQQIVWFQELSMKDGVVFIDKITCIHPN